jgi:xyloglucan O-acetyltransferase
MCLGKAADGNDPPPCDYSEGQWVQTTVVPLYNGTSCETIKWAQNCMVNGRPDTGYLYWQWQPKDSRCPAPVFDASLFLQIIKNKHLAFTGDSLARNQLESLMCLLSTASKPDLVYQDSKEPQFRRWVFHEYNATVSVFWSPFLVKGIEKDDSKGIQHNTLYLDTPNEKWASELDKMDMVVFSNGHWFVQKAIYYGERNQLLGCHSVRENECPDFNFFDAFRKVIHTALKEVINRFHGSNKTVVVTTFTSGHFEGEWDKFGACPKTEPYKEGDKEMPYLEKEMRKAVIEEVAMAVKEVKEMDGRLRIEALDVTKLALLRPDGHPGSYMYPNPFADGMKKNVRNDCVHWCMPGPIDTWNAILLELMKRWN